MSTTVFLDDGDINGIDLLSKELHIFLAFGRYKDSRNDPDFGKFLKKKMIKSLRMN